MNQHHKVESVAIFEKEIASSQSIEVDEKKFAKTTYSIAY